MQGARVLPGVVGEQPPVRARYRSREGGTYDCIVPYSGGKDSVFQLWYIVTQLKLKPLVVRYNHWGYRPQVGINNTSVFKQLGVDVVEFTTNFHVVREVMLESLKRRGDFCWHCHTGIYAGVMHMAVRFEVPRRAPHGRELGLG